MVPTLQQLCSQKIVQSNIKGLDTTLNPLCYSKIIDEYIKRGYESWKKKINLVNLEVEIEDIDVSIDMMFSDPINIIEVQKKNSQHYEPELYHPYNYNTNRDMYDAYYYIADKRGLIEYPFMEELDPL